MNPTGPNFGFQDVSSFVATFGSVSTPDTPKITSVIKPPLTLSRFWDPQACGRYVPNVPAVLKTTSIF